MVVRHGAPSEATARQRRVQRDLLRLETRLLRRCVAVAGLELGAGPHFAMIGLHVSNAIDWLHWRVGQVGHVVGSFELFRRLLERAGRVPILVGGHARLLRELLVLFELLAAVQCRLWPVVPDDRQRLAALFRRPEAVGDDGDAARDLDNMLHAWDGLCLLGVEALDFAAEDRRGDEHTRQLHVETEDSLPANLVGRVEALGRLADDTEILRILELDVLLWLEVSRFLGEFPVRQFFPRRGVDYVSWLSAAGCRFDVPLRGRGGDEHGASGRAGLAHPLPLAPGAAAAARHLDAVNRVVVDRSHRRGLEMDFLPVRVQLLGDEHRDARVRPLAHFSVIDDHGDGVVAADAHEGVERERPTLLRRLVTCGARRQVQAQDQAAAGEQAGAEESAAAEVENLAHFAPPFAASSAAAWIALRIRG